MAINTLLNNQWVKEEIKREIKKYPETNENENTITKNLWDASTTVFSGKFIVINVYIKEKETLQTN